MALLKHRGITRASYDALIAPDPNTEYTVLETDGTFTRYVGSKAIKDKTAARLDGDGNFDLSGKDIKNVKEMTVEELTSLIDKIVVKKTLELQSDINFDGHKAIRPNIENGVLENELDANSQEILNPILRGAKRIGDAPVEEDDILDLKYFLEKHKLYTRITEQMYVENPYSVNVVNSPVILFPSSLTGYGNQSMICILDISTYSDNPYNYGNLVLSNYNKSTTYVLSDENIPHEEEGGMHRLVIITNNAKTYIFHYDYQIQDYKFLIKFDEALQYGYSEKSGAELNIYGCVCEVYRYVGGLL